MASSLLAAEYPEGVTEISYLSKADDTKQPALWWAPPKPDSPVPLLVALHTWSGDYRQTGSQLPLAHWCQQMGWAFIHPNFRGPNWTPEALGSDLAVGDITSAVEFAKKTRKIDENRIYCIGVSGGGHASMLIAARAPRIWAGVSAWCGISDVAAWHQQCRESKFSRYADHIEKALQGTPAEQADDARQRSPIFWLEKNRNDLPPLDIWHGIHDGRTGSVPFTQSLRAWNATVPDSEKVSESFIKQFYQAQSFPETKLPDCGDRRVWYQQVHQNVRVSIFEGGHEILPEPALNWLAAQVKGKAPDWNPKPVAKLKIKPADTKSGK